MKCFEQYSNDEMSIELNRKNNMIRITNIINALTNDDLTKFYSYYAKADKLIKFSKELEKIEKVVYKLE